MRRASSSAASARSGSRPGAGASTSVQMPLLLDGLDDRPHGRLPERRARQQSGELAAQGHPLLDHQRGAGGQQLVDRAPRLLGVVEHPHAAPVVAAAHGLEHHRPAVLGGEGQRRPRGSTPRRTAARAPRARRAGVRMTSLSCACSSASGPGWTVWPSATRARRCSPGTCSWSKVIASAPAPALRRASRSVCSPRTTSGATSAAGSSGPAASTRSDCPRATAAWCVIRAS